MVETKCMIVLRDINDVIVIELSSKVTVLNIIVSTIMIAVECYPLSRKFMCTLLKNHVLERCL